MRIQTDHMKDFLIGFFFLPFLWFMFSTTIVLASSPESISEGRAIIYIALVTGIYYIFSQDKKSSIVFTEKPQFKIAKTLGMLLFLAAYYGSRL